MSTDLAYVNGRVTPASEASVPALDRGFLFGDACYEVVRVYDGVPWHLDEHLERLRRSAAGLRLAQGPTAAEWTQIATTLWAQSGLRDGRLYFQLTRGAAPIRSAPLSAAAHPTVVVMAEAAQWPSERTYAEGVKAITVPESRWERSDYKTTNLMPRVLVRMDAQAAGAYEALWVDARGRIREGTATNFFAVIDGEVRTQALEPGVVAGVTREEVLAVAAALGMPTRQSEVTRRDLHSASEAFLTGTSPEVLGVVAVDDQPIGAGRVGPHTRALHEGYRDRVRAFVRAHAQTSLPAPPTDG